MIKRIMDKQTNLFIRDDFTYNEEIEISLDVQPSQGLYLPKWNGETWIEGATQEYIDNLKTQVVIEPSLDERVGTVEVTIDELVDVLASIVGV